MISLRHKLWFGFGALLAVLIAVSVITVIALTHHSHALERVFRDNYDSVIYCEGMNDALDQLNSRAQHFLGKRDPAIFADIAQIIREFDDNLKLQIGNAHMPTELPRTRELENTWTSFKDLYARLPINSDPANLYRDELLPRFDSMKKMAHDIAALNVSNMVSVGGQVKRTLMDVRNVLIIFVISGAVLAAAILWAAGAAILNPIRTLTRSARQVEQGDLDLTLAVSSTDEIGELAEAFNAMAAKLREFRRIDHDRLSRTEQTTQLAIDSLPDAVFVIGPDGRIEISNRTARTHFGIEPGKSVADIGVKWLVPLYEAIQLAQRPVESQDYKSAVQLFENGEERFLLPRAVPMMEHGRLIGITVILADITRLRRVDEAKSSVISTVSHELRTPLTGLRMSLSLLASDSFGSVSTDQRKLIGASREDSDRLYRIIENLLNISRIESGRSQFQFRPMAAAEIISLALDPLRPIFDEKKIALTVHSPAGLANVRAGAMSIGSALTNLLTNALKFTPTDGKIRVAAEMEDGSVTFSVEDSGVGIPDEYCNRIFEKFFRIPLASGPTGAGLGLTIAKEIVEAHNGTIGFRSAAPSGTTFWFKLPVA